MDLPWPAPTDFVWGEALPTPDRWGRPGLVMVFNLECAGCVSRGVPFLKRLAREHEGRVTLMALHTSRGHRLLARGDVEPTLVRFARDFARLPLPVALDLDGSLAEAWGTEGTPHWLAFDARGELARSVYGSQDGARTRLEYLLEELAAGAGGGERQPSS